MPSPPRDPHFSKPSKDALEPHTHEARGGGALSRSIDLRKCFDVLLAEPTTIVLDDQAAAVLGEAKCYGARIGVEGILEEFGKIGPRVVERQLERPKHSLSIRRSMDFPVLLGQLFHEGPSSLIHRVTYPSTGRSQVRELFLAPSGTFSISSQLCETQFRSCVGDSSIRRTAKSWTCSLADARCPAQNKYSSAVMPPSCASRCATSVGTDRWPFS